MILLLCFMKAVSNAWRVDLKDVYSKRKDEGYLTH